MSDHRFLEQRNTYYNIFPEFVFLFFGLAWLICSCSHNFTVSITPYCFVMLSHAGWWSGTTNMYSYVIFCTDLASEGNWCGSYHSKKEILNSLIRRVHKLYQNNTCFLMLQTDLIINKKSIKWINENKTKQMIVYQSFVSTHPHYNFHSKLIARNHCLCQGRMSFIFDDKNCSSLMHS